ncbi:MAG: hypothetical protein SFX18_05885 [Pirellulales bacterium]|nr:hypothetical protein [Pirellulales bacterium]
MLYKLLLLAALAGTLFYHPTSARALEVAFGEVDITPNLNSGRPVWLAGYGMGRKATAVHDPILARCVLIKDGQSKLAFACVDLIGLQYPEVQRIRAGLGDYQYVMVSSSHSHEGPDVIGIWGANPLSRGVDDEYLRLVVDKVTGMIRAAEKSFTPAVALYGTATDETLLNDSRQPQVKDGVLRLVKFVEPNSQKTLGLWVQWNCHPEAMGADNTELTGDFCATTVAELRAKHQCPVAYFSGAVGGLLAPPRGGRIKDANQRELHEGDWEYSRIYGQEVAKLADEAVAAAQPIQLTPLAVSAKPLSIPVDNVLYRMARTAQVLKRPATIWNDKPYEPGPEVLKDTGKERIAMLTEVAYVRLGDLHVACIPGELYPELVYGKYQEPAEANADFPTSKLEPSVAATLPGDKWLCIGLANDEVGYIIPRRQWDDKAPFAYGRDKSQYGEVNSCGPETAPLLMQGLMDCVRAAGK